MKKLLLLLILNSFLFLDAQIISEDFEGSTFPPTGWTKDNTNASRAWDLSSTVFNASGQATFNISGSQSAAIDWVAGNNDANLISPTFSLIGYSNANFSFNVKVGWSYLIDQNAGNLVAKISNDGGSTWTSVWNEDSESGFVDDGDSDPDTDLYNTVAVNIDISSYIGQSNLKFKFQYTADDADAVSIDDVIIDGVLSNDSFLNTSFTTYPNPASNSLFIRNKDNITINTITITDLNGRIVKEENYINQITSTKVDVSQLSSNIYILKINTPEGTEVRKIIIE